MVGLLYIKIYNEWRLDYAIYRTIGLSKSMGGLSFKPRKQLHIRRRSEPLQFKRSCNEHC